MTDHESELATLRARVEELERERKNLCAGLTARAKTLLRLRDALVQVHDHIEDEGDRVYFGSTNDAEILKDVWHELDGWAWDDIMEDGKVPDIYEASRKAHARAEAAESRLSEATRLAVEAMEPFADISDLVDSETEGVDDSDQFDLMFHDYLMERFTLFIFRRARTALDRLTNIMGESDGG